MDSNRGQENRVRNPTTEKILGIAYRRAEVLAQEPQSPEMIAALENLRIAIARVYSLL